MSNEPRNLGAERARRSRDCRLWTPLEALKDLVRRMESGELKDVDMVYVAYREWIEPNIVEYGYAAAGGTNIELSGLLAQHLHRVCMPNHD